MDTSPQPSNVPTFDAAVNRAKLEPQTYLYELLARAEQLHLADDQTWHVLLLYKKSWLSGLASQVDDPNFFLSQNGKSDPQSELAATLAGFFSNQPIKPTKYSAQCRFPARYHWLNQKLQFDAARLAPEPCGDFQTLFTFLSPASLTVVFPATHPNSPSSMFGHTLMRFDKAGRNPQERMLDYSVSYAADFNPDVDGFSYAVLGMTGGFPGRFSFVPYYWKLREYAEMENRDVWEFTLKLAQKDIDFIFMHAFELGTTFFQYYFFSENCSYHLFSLLDLAFPDDKLTDETRAWTIPVDTVKILNARGLIDQVNYYPSLAREIKTGMQSLSPQDVQLALQLHEAGLDRAENRLQSLEPQRQAAILDLLGKLFQYHRIKKDEKLTPQMGDAERTVLRLRSRIRTASAVLPVPAPSVSPEQGHDTARVGFASMQLKDRTYSLLEWRPAYHDLLDASRGFVSNSGLEFMALRLRYDEREKRIALHEWDIFDIFSAEPRESIFRPVSWHMHMQYRQQLDALEQWKSTVQFYGGPGLTYRLFPRKENIVYLFGNINLLQGDLFEHDYSVAPGVLAGLVVEPVPNWRILLEGNTMRGIAGDKTTHTYVRLGQGVSLSKNSALRLFLQEERLLGVTRRQSGLAFYLYY